MSIHFGIVTWLFGSFSLGLLSFSAFAETFSPIDGSNLVLGRGYNSVTGEARGDCIEIHHLVKAEMSVDALKGNLKSSSQCESSGQCIDFSVSEIHDSNELVKSLGLSFNAKIGIGVFSVGTKASYYNKSKFTKENIHIVLNVNVRNVSETLRDSKLVDWARDLLINGDRATFLKRCGDSFISGRTTGGEFSVYFNIFTASEENRRKIQTKLSTAGLGWNTGASFASTLQEISEETRVDIRMFKNGGIDQLPNYKDIRGIFEFAKKFPETVRINSSASSVTLLSTLDYETLSNFTGEGVSLSTQRQVLETITTSKDEAFKRFSEADEVLQNPDRFEAHEAGAILKYRNKLSDMIDQLVNSARTCETDPFNCKLPQLDWPRFSLPSKLPILPVSSSDPRIVNAPEFRQLGKMIESGGLIWSGIVTNQSYFDAVKFCHVLDSSKGGGARLPTIDEIEALSKAGRKAVAGKRPNSNVIPDWEGWSFLSSSVVRHECYDWDGGFCVEYFSVLWGKKNVCSRSHVFKEIAFRCVREAS